MGESKHITEVIKSPGAFELTEEEIRSVYEKYNEPFGIEGKAREEIILELIRKGWIRARRYTRPDRWTVNLSCMNDYNKYLLKQWAGTMLQAGYGEHEEISLDQPGGRETVTLKELTAGNNPFPAGLAPETHKFFLIKNVYEFTVFVSA